MYFKLNFFKCFVLLGSLILLFSCEKQPGNVFYTYSPQGVATLDPANVLDINSYSAAVQIYEGLYEYGSDGKIVPLLAESMPVFSADGKLAKIHLRKNVRFSDDPCFTKFMGTGRIFTASDFIYSLNRYLSGPFNSGTYFARIFKSSIKSYRATDDFTLEFEFNRPVPYFPSLLSGSAGFVIPREAVEYYGADFSRHPVGTGPYRLLKWNKGKKLVFVRNSNYDRGINNIEKVVTYILEDDEPRWLNFLKGNIDILIPDRDNYYAAFPARGKLSPLLKAKGVKVYKTPGRMLVYFGFNFRDRIIADNKYLRQAISLAFNSANYNAIFYNSTGKIANWLIPQGVPGYDKYFSNKYLAYDPEMAKKLLGKAGFENVSDAPEIVVYVPNDFTSIQIAEFFAKALKNIGLRTKITSQSYAFYKKGLVEGGNFHIFNMSWQGEYLFPEDYLRLLYRMTPGDGNINYTGYNNAAFNALFKKLATTFDMVSKKRIIRKMRSIAVEDCPVIPAVFPSNLILLHSYIKNLSGFDPLKFKNLVIDIEKKKEVLKNL